MQIKVCGITQLTQAESLDQLGINYIGFVFYAPSKRYVLNYLDLNQIFEFNPIHAKKVGVFVNETIENVITIIQNAKLDMVQLHGDEDASFCEKINKIVPVIKAFRVSQSVPNFLDFENTVSYFLLDTDSHLYGGTGQHFNWDIIKNTHFNKPFFLSGGIGPNDVQGIEVLKKTIAGKYLSVIDINSQFEISPGIKNLALIKTFLYANI